MFTAREVVIALPVKCGTDKIISNNVHHLHMCSMGTLFVILKHLKINSVPCCISGSTGPMGATGAAGSAGPVGATGTPGKKGDPGAEGKQGTLLNSGVVYLMIIRSIFTCSLW